MSLTTLLPNDPAPGEQVGQVADLLSEDVREFAASWRPDAVPAPPVGVITAPAHERRACRRTAPRSACLPRGPGQRE